MQELESAGMQECPDHGPIPGEQIRQRALGFSLVAPRSGQGAVRTAGQRRSQPSNQESSDGVLALLGRGIRVHLASDTPLRPPAACAPAN